MLILSKYMVLCILQCFSNNCNTAGCWHIAAPSFLHILLLTTVHSYKRWLKTTNNVQCDSLTRVQRTYWHCNTYKWSNEQKLCQHPWWDLSTLYKAKRNNKNLQRNISQKALQDMCKAITKQNKIRSFKRQQIRIILVKTAKFPQLALHSQLMTMISSENWTTNFCTYHIVIWPT